MKHDDFLTGAGFAGAALVKSVLPPTAELQTTITQSVPKLEGPEEERKLLGEDANATIDSWDGFWADPVYQKVVGPDVPPEEAKRDFFKYQIDQSISLAEFFPSLSDSALGAVTFNKSAVEYWARPVGNEPAGLYFRTEVEFAGPLHDVFAIFKVFLAEAKPTLRLSAYLGLGMEPQQLAISDGLALSGSLLGLAVEYPPAIPIITVLSIGVQVTICTSPAEKTVTADAADSGLVQHYVFGSLALAVPGSLLPLALDYRAKLSDNIMTLNMTIQDKDTWTDALGVPGFNVSPYLFNPARATMLMSAAAHRGRIRGQLSAGTRINDRADSLGRDRSVSPGCPGGVPHCSMGSTISEGDTAGGEDL